MKKNNLINSKGISVIFLVIAMLLMIIIGYVFSYLIPSKQKSVVFPIQSTQAFFIAQSGVEFAVRFADQNNWRTPALLNNLNTPPNNTRTLGAGRFTLTYTNTAPNLDTLFSFGEVPSGTVRRSIRVSNFTQFVAITPLIIDPNSPVPCLITTSFRFLFWWFYQYEVYFYIRNVSSTNIVLDSFRATWTTDPPSIDRVMLDGTQRWSGTYANGDARTYFSSTHSIAAGDTIQVRIRWGWSLTANCDFSNLIVYFYDTNNNMHTFTLDPEGDGIPDC